MLALSRERERVNRGADIIRRADAVLAIQRMDEALDAIGDLVKGFGWT